MHRFCNVDRQRTTNQFKCDCPRFVRSLCVFRCDPAGMRRGDVVRLTGLVSRAELNDRDGIVVEDVPVGDDRWPVCMLGTSPIIGVNVRTRNLVHSPDVPPNIRVQAWNDLGVAYSRDAMYVKSLRALRDGVRTAVSHMDAPGVRDETCRCLSNIAWLCLLMNRRGIGLSSEDESVRDVMEWAMRQIFSGVIETIAPTTKLLFGAGTLPGSPTQRLIMTAVAVQDDAEDVIRYFVVDEDHGRVYEHTGTTPDDTVPSTDGAKYGATSIPVPSTPPPSPTQDEDPVTVPATPHEEDPSATAKTTMEDVGT